MQRQSLGSPGSKLHSHGGGGLVVTAKEEKSLSIEDSKQIVDDKENKIKAIRSSPRPEKLIHLIPFLTLFCFFILYICSHDPTQSDLAQFNGFRGSSKPIVDSTADATTTTTTEFGRFLEMDKSDILAVRSLRNLQEIRKRDPKSRYHRKIGDF